MSDRWWDYFNGHMVSEHHWLEGAVSHWQFFQNFYGMVLGLLPKGGRVLDVGCGPGYSDLYFAARGLRVTGVDNDERIVNLARSLGERLAVPLEYQQGDAFNLGPFYGRFDMAYSVGVLEHFDRDVTVKLLKEQAKCAHMVLICIPTRYTCYSDGITDERIYSMRQLKEIVHEAGLEVVCGFGFGDVTVTPVQVWFKRLLPHAFYRLMQNRGFAFNIAVVGMNPEFCPVAAE